MTKDYRHELQGLLRKLFQFDSADLDFGIYRIMNYKRDEIEKFIEEDIIKAVDVEFEKYSAKSKEEIEKELEEIKKRIASTLGQDALLPSGDIKEMYRSSPIAKEYYRKKEDLKNNEMANQHKAEIFSHIYQFFSRYYDEGDFISQRRYSRKNKYAVPYNGEEVLLHWANKDQYYIKSGEYFKNYSFKIGDYNINFGLINAETNQDNNNGANRFFLLKDFSENIIYNECTKELNILFEYRALASDEITIFGTKDVQKKILGEVQAIIIKRLDNNALKGALLKQDGERTLLEKHLFRYTKRNTTDYFIHKDLCVFLSCELDFYIKNEVLMIDDLCSENEVDIEGYIGRIKIIKSISQKIIIFLAQIEEFQKKLWLKKKFVVETSWCISIDTILKNKDDAIFNDLLAEIIDNKAQREEWVRLLSIDEIQPDLEAPGYSAPLTEEFIMAHPTLMIDTRYFSPNFAERLLQTVGNIDEETDGVLIHGENLQALSLMQARYLEKIRCIYIDPPYNTDAGPIDYKNGYRSSSWMSMIHDRLATSRKLLSPDGVLCITIDDYQVHELAMIIDQEFGREKQLGTAVIRNNPSGRSTVSGLSVCHEYAFFYRNGESSLRRLPRSEKQLERFSEENGVYVDWRNFRKDGGAVTHRSERPKQYYPIYIRLKEQTLRIPTLSWNSANRAWDILEDPAAGEVVLWPIDDKGQERVWSLNHISALANIGDLEVRITRNGLPQVYRRHLPSEDGVLPRSWWDKNTYAAREHGSATLTQLFGSATFSFAKSPFAVQDSLWVSGLAIESEREVLDYFAGSGTTGHAVINLNREDGGRRKFILVEMASYFDTVLLPRLKKVIFTPDWKNGKPKRLATYTENERSPRMLKIIRIESYEDTLNNIEYYNSGVAQRTLDDLDGYFLRYMLDFDTRDSTCRMNVGKLNRPFDYSLKIIRNNEIRVEEVDLVETFNYLLGLHVKRIKVLDNNGAHYKVIHGSKGEDKITIIWRDIDILDLKKDKAFIEDHILKEFRANKVYVNSDCFAEGIIPIEPEFKRLMGA